MNTVNIIFWGTLVIYVAVSFYVSGRIKTAKDYYVMGSRASTFWVAGCLMASYLSAVTFVGIAGIEYLNGPPIFLLVYGSWLGTVVAMLYVGRKLRAYGAMTMPDFIELRFGPKVRLVATIIMIVGLLGYGLVQFMGAGVLLSSVTGIPYNVIIGVFAIALVLFCVAAGMWSVVVTDTLMNVAMFVGCFVIAPIIIYKVGGLESLASGLMAKDPLLWSSGGALLQKPVGWSVGQLVLWALFFPAAPWVAMRAFPSRNDFVLMRSIAWSTLLLTMAVTVLFLGCSATLLINSEIKPPDRVFIWICQASGVPAILGGIGIAGIMAAILSTAATIFIGTGFALSRDLYERSTSRQLTDKQKILYARLAQIVVGVVIFIFSLFKPPAIYWVGAWAGALFATAWMPMLVAGFEMKKATRAGAIASMIMGGGSYILLYQMVVKWKIFKLPLGVDPVIVAVILSFAAIWIVSSLTKPKEEDISAHTRLAAISLSHETIASLSAGDLKREIAQTKFAAWASIVGGVIFFGWLMIKIIPLV